jgi:hypothetical protein
MLILILNKSTFQAQVLVEIKTLMRLAETIMVTMWNS